MQEIWKDVDGFNGLYSVSNLGRVRVAAHLSTDGRHFPAKMIAVVISKRDGYGRVNMRKNGKPYAATIHRLVANAFIPNPGNKPEINHKNGDKTDNRVSNLEWCTPKENQQHALKMGLRGVHTSGTAKPVAMYSKSGELLHQFPSLGEAARYVNGHITCISRAAAGITKSSYGYKWAYVRRG